jgi:hypothetical protein
LNTIEYLFCERLFGQVLLIEKKCGRKNVRQKIRRRKRVIEKSRQEKCGIKTMEEKVRQNNRDRKIVAKKLWQKNRG